MAAAVLGLDSGINAVLRVVPTKHLLGLGLGHDTRRVVVAAIAAVVLIHDCFASSLGSVIRQAAAPVVIWRGILAVRSGQGCGVVGVLGEDAGVL